MLKIKKALGIIGRRDLISNLPGCCNGSQACLRCMCRKAWRFDSSPGHPLTFCASFPRMSQVGDRMNTTFFPSATRFELSSFRYSLHFSSLACFCRKEAVRMSSSAASTLSGRECPARSKSRKMSSKVFS